MTFKNKVYIEANLVNSVTGQIIAGSYSVSTLKPVNDVTQNLLPPLIMKSYGQDIDNDGVNE